MSYSIYEIIHNMRIIKGYSLAYVSEKIGCAGNTLSNWEKGKISPPVDSALKLCDIYGITPNQLFGLDPIPEIDDFIHRKREVLAQINALQKEKSDIERKLKEYYEELSRRQ